MVQSGVLLSLLAFVASSSTALAARGALDSEGCVRAPGRDLLGRPTLTGPVRTSSLGRYKLHWTRSGDDAPNLEDLDHNARPDLIDAVLAALVQAEADYAAEGWRTLAGDNGGGDGSDDIDVYLHQIGAYGYAHSVASTDNDGWSCYLELDADLSPAGHVAQSVATHELHHCIEFRYTTSLAVWLYESAATYEQYTHVVDPALDYPLGILYTERLGDPGRRLGFADGSVEYSAFLWMKFWTERGGFAPERLPLLWDDLRSEDDWKLGLDEASENAFDQGLAETFVEYAVWNSFACAGSDGEHYDDTVLPCLPTITVPTEPWDGAPLHLVHEDSPFTAAYYEYLPADRSRLGVTCQGVPGTRFAVVALDADGAGRDLATGESGDVLAVDPAGGPIRLVVAGTEDPLDATCELVPVPTNPLAQLAELGCDSTGGADPGAAVLIGLALLRRRSR
jgi:hypothetical protein